MQGIYEIVHLENTIQNTIFLFFFCFDDHGGHLGLCDMGHPMHLSQGFALNHWMLLPLKKKYFCCTTPVAAMVINVGDVQSHTKQNLFS